MSDNSKRGRSNGTWIAELDICLAKGAEIPEDDTHLLERLARNETPSNLRSETCLSLAANWLNKCSREHAECDSDKDKPAFLPTRVIDVGSLSTPPHLHVSGDSETGKWVALSYCGGADSSFTLNASSFDNLRSGLPLSDFPPTLQDAVLVTRALGVRYLWIDALCIFQDNTNELTAEASRTSHVYSNAVVTIAATSAETVNDGFLDKREPHFNCSFPWRRQDHPESVKDGCRTYPVFFRNGRSPLNKDWPRDSRWATSGWTLQEELLSKQVLYYTKREMIWQCRSGKATEPEEEFTRDPTLFSKLKGLLAGSDSSEDSKRSMAAIYKAWYELLEEYTRRDLTSMDDPLPAIGAIAESFDTQLKEQYCAGLWRGDLLFGLLWSFHCSSGGSGPPGRVLRRALLRLFDYQDKHPTLPARQIPTGVSKGRGPSWSWVGADDFAGITWPRESGTFDYLAKVVRVEVRDKLHDEFRSVEGAVLALDAPYRHVHLRLGTYSKSPRNPISLIQRALTRLSPLARTRKLAEIALMRPDYLAATTTSGSVIVPSSSTEFTLVQLAKTSIGPRPVLYVLVLQRHKRYKTNSVGPQRYRRVGLLRLMPSQPDNDDYIGEAMTDLLEGAAYREVTKKEWPVGTFVID
ncbi:heterokaryon incompatibility protein-domain-containing protein [Aspergillus caelatus]|uniref:Heterokaryon incompatibility protein-domain-containing protein n=1 Tax=Aspergillus caelatus TaxID=61420 RepID=A0A5N7A5E5_9EURO|nr:heterokaryon incompatibility protein-domain-containing protein [Aspergillus caelatus]KAE8365077.1 heterokaryon incompatibility protein-domain-containing protein [Aspergillus caelatus]